MYMIMLDTVRIFWFDGHGYYLINFCKFLSMNWILDCGLLCINLYGYGFDGLCLCVLFDHPLFDHVIHEVEWEIPVCNIFWMPIIELTVSFSPGSWRHTRILVVVVQQVMIMDIMLVAWCSYGPVCFNMLFTCVSGILMICTLHALSWSQCMTNGFLLYF